MRYVVSIGLLLAFLTPAYSLDGPTLPTTAKKLTKEEIVTLMDGKTFKYKSYNKAKLMTGETTFDFKKGVYSGTYAGKPYSPQPLSMNSSAYCYDKTCPEGSGAVYVDGNTIYEVNGAGAVGEVLTK